eukprot:21122-Heterococcus_DN1.PRE.1
MIKYKNWLLRRCCLHTVYVLLPTALSHAKGLQTSCLRITGAWNSLRPDSGAYKTALLLTTSDCASNKANTSTSTAACWIYITGTTAALSAQTRLCLLTCCGTEAMLRAVMNAIALGSTRLAVTASMFAQ